MKSKYFHQQVPQHYNLMQVLDLFFKACKVFNVDYHKNVTHFFNVLEKFVYGIGSGEITPKNLESAKIMFS